MLVAGWDRPMLAAWDRLRCEMPELTTLNCSESPNGTPTLAEAKPVVILYVSDGCPPCMAAKTALAAATDLPFRIVTSRKLPAYVTIVPAFDWGPPDDKPELVGWPGLPEMLKRYRGG